jgi:hypothetical protein
MKKIALIFVTVATLATTLASPVEARGWRGGGWGWGPGIGLGIAAGALAAGAYGAYGPYDLTAMVLDTTATTGRDMHTTDRASTGRATITDGS